jgi:hypothetical protein
MKYLFFALMALAATAIAEDLTDKNSVLLAIPNVEPCAAFDIGWFGDSSLGDNFTNQ